MMDQWEEVSEINYLLQMVDNGTDGSPMAFNFSHSVVKKILGEFVSNMNTIRQPETIVLVCLYIPVFLLSLVGNSVVIYVVARNPNMRKVKNIFLVNLACADLGVTLTCMPIVSATKAFRMWVYGEFMCKFSGYIQGVAVTASIWTLAALSIDRYLAIRVPLSARRLRRSRQAAEVVGFIWVISALVIGPMLYVRTVTHVEGFQTYGVHLSYCIEEWKQLTNKRAYAVFLLVIIYALPISVIAVCYSLIGKTLCVTDLHRKSSDGSGSTVAIGRKRVARMLIALICVFLICWLPYNVCSLSLDIRADLLDTKVLWFTLWFAHAHSAINPFLYWFLNKSFRSYMRRAVRCQYIRVIRDTQSPPQAGDEFDDGCGTNFRAAHAALVANKQTRLREGLGRGRKRHHEYSPVPEQDEPPLLRTFPLTEREQPIPDLAINRVNRVIPVSVETHRPNIPSSDELVASDEKKNKSALKRAHSAMPDICTTDESPATQSTHIEQDSKSTHGEKREERDNSNVCMLKRAHSALASLLRTVSDNTVQEQGFQTTNIGHSGLQPPDLLQQQQIPSVSLHISTSNSFSGEKSFTTADSQPKNDVIFIVGSSTERESSLVAQA